MRSGIVYTLVFIKTDSKILLGLKKRGLGKDKWNGFGGKVEKGETILEGAIRETKEECNLTVENLNHIGVLTYEERKSNKIDIVHVFTTTNFDNDLKESDEMIPKWFELSQVPFQKMWPDQLFWHACMKANKFFHAHAIYSENDEFVDCKVEEFETLNKVLENVDRIIHEKSKNCNIN